MENLRYTLDKNSPVFLFERQGSSCGLDSLLVDVLFSTSLELLDLGVFDAIEMGPG